MHDFMSFTTSLLTQKKIEGSLRHSRVVSWTFQAEEDSGDSDGITTFQCSASDETRDKEVTKLVDVLVTLETGIDGERSNTTVHDDPVGGCYFLLVLNLILIRWKPFRV